MAMVDSPGAFTDFAVEQEDVVFPCKGCGEILEEGKAFELAGNRWHIDCFRCNTCGTLLDSDANLLLLGDGSLICNNCTYSCSACGNKIEDLAILTGDQAFCANCFKCRNCKRKIDNLRYARTSQGIFCMSCHESLMARRRKNKKASRNPVPASNGLNKSLPELPRSDIPSSAFSSTPDMETPPSEKGYSEYGETSLELSPRPRNSKQRQDAGSTDRTPVLDRDHSIDDSRKESLTLPASTFQGSRESTLSKVSGISYDTANGDDFFGTVPLLLDTNQNPNASPATNGRDFVEPHVSQAGGRLADAKAASRDYFNRTQAPSRSSARDMIREATRESSRSSSMERRQPASPHVAYQQKGRQTSDHISELRRKEPGPQQMSPALGRSTESPVTTTSYPTPPTLHTDFKLQEAPKPKKSSSRRSSKSNNTSPVERSPIPEPSSHKNTPRIDGAMTTSPKRIGSSSSFGTSDYGSPNMGHSKESSQSEVAPAALPKRGDSLAAAVKQSLPRKEVGGSNLSSGPTTPTPPSTFYHQRDTSSTSIPMRQPSDGVYQPTGVPRSSSRQTDSPIARAVMDSPNGPPPRASSRPNAMGLANNNENMVAPRAPPPALPAERHRATTSTTSTSTVQTDSTSRLSPVNLPRHSTGGDFTLDDEMDAILRGEEKSEPGTLRKLSNAVRHGRSFSDRGAGARSASSSQKWSKSPLNGSIDISSPTSASSPDAREENILLKNKIRQAQERVAKLEVEKNQLQGMVDGSVDISQVNTELKQKRSTMAFLDTQREIVVRELEVMTEHLRKAKESNQPLDLNTLKSGVLSDFASSLQRLKDTMGSQIEELMQRRNELTREIDDLIQMKDKGFQEYESLSSRNHQLTQHNNELIANIQGSMKAVAQPHPNNGGPAEPSRVAPNGLGLYIQHTNAQHTSMQPLKERSESSNEVRTLTGSEYSNPNLLNDNEADGTVLATPQVVKIGKGKPNILKKGTQGFVKNFRNIRNNIASDNRFERIEGRSNNGQWVEGTPYNQLPVQNDQNGYPNISKPYADPSGRQKFGGFFGSEKDKGHLKHLKNSQNNSSSNLAVGDAASNLFGSDLAARCEYEKRVIPCIVSRCIEEVELRGMDVEGVYRKSGGSGQVNMVRMGFEKDSDYDISEPELDIHAVTSTLKQYFRRLPTPLITFDVYDQMLEASRVEDIDKRALAMRDAINALPKAHKDCLEFLVFHLAKVMSHEAENLMTPLNLAVVFAPTIMRPQTIEREMTDMQSQRIAVQSLLEMNQTIFGYDA